MRGHLLYSTARQPPRDRTAGGRGSPQPDGSREAGRADCEFFPWTGIFPQSPSGPFLNNGGCLGGGWGRRIGSLLAVSREGSTWLLHLRKGTGSTRDL